MPSATSIAQLGRAAHLLVLDRLGYGEMGFNFMSSIPERAFLHFVLRPEVSPLQSLTAIH